MPRSVWALPSVPGAEELRPEDVYYNGERDVDFGEVLRGAASHLTKVTSATGFGEGCTLFAEGKIAA